MSIEDLNQDDYVWASNCPGDDWLLMFVEFDLCGNVIDQLKTYIIGSHKVTGDLVVIQKNLN